MSFKINLLIFILAQTIFGCGSSERIIRLPYYKECLADVVSFRNGYEKKFAGTNKKLNIKIVKFDTVPEVHQSISGYLEITGNNLSFDLETYSNGIKAICYPENKLAVDNSSIGLKNINSEIHRNLSQGIKNNYVLIDDSSIVLYWNEKDIRERY